jgi:hypothetical protein
MGIRASLAGISITGITLALAGNDAMGIKLSSAGNDALGINESLAGHLPLVFWWAGAAGRAWVATAALAARIPRCL